MFLYKVSHLHTRVFNSSHFIYFSPFNTLADSKIMADVVLSAINRNTIHSLLGSGVVQADNNRSEEPFEELVGKKFDELNLFVLECEADHHQ